MSIIQHTQMFRHDPDNGVYGDCWRATVACLLRLPVEDVPHVCDGPDDGKASERMRAFLESQGCALIQVPFNGDMSLQQILEYVGAMSVSGGLHWCLMGTSQTGCNHVVICKGAEIIHDPSITQSGIVGPASDGLWWVEWVVQRTACDSPSPQTREVVNNNGSNGETSEKVCRNDPNNDPENENIQPPVQHLVGRWLPIDQADKSVERVIDLPKLDLKISNSEDYWVRDADGRAYRATWADDGKRAYWWDFEGESPVDPVEFMPHPLDPRWASAPEVSE